MDHDDERGVGFAIGGVMDFDAIRIRISVFEVGCMERQSEQ